MSDPILTIDHVEKRYAGFHAVKGVSMVVERGEFLTLLGPSGCGKTTLLRMIAGLEQPSSGEILIGGAPVTRMPPYKRNLGMVFQNLALFPHLTVGENVAFGLKVRHTDTAAIAPAVTSALGLVGLDHLADRAVHQLSGGQRQRVALARALAVRPEVLLLDEPLSALDMKLRRQLQVELKQLQRQVGTTFIFVTHDQEEALSMSDRIAVMNDGRVEQLASAQEVYTRPATLFAARFVGDNNVLTARAGDVGTDPGKLYFPALGMARPVPGLASLAPGQEVHVAVRPEHIRVQTAETGTAVVENQVYSGSSVRLALRTATDTILATIAADATTVASYAVGTRVHIDWPDTACTVIPAAAGAPL
ncbi:MAG TPA: ABC transporter ATP-binding protein [Bordetella sp.]